MRTYILFPLSVIFSILFFNSCDTNNIENQNTPGLSDSVSNYWNASTLIHQHLNGKVKTVVSGMDTNKQIDTYNEAGYITSTLYSNESITDNYIYDSIGVLKNINKSFNGINKTYLTTYKYSNTGKFIVVQPNNLTTYGLIPNLSSLINNELGTTVDYNFNGNNLVLITTFSTQKDTAIITYNGQYPTDIKWHLLNNILHTKDIVFYDNGMFKAFTNESSGPDYLYQTKYYFRYDTNFQLIDSVVTINTTQSKTTHSAIKYSYDSNRNIIHYEVPNTTKDDTDVYNVTYIYDSHNNWITKTTTSTNSTNSSGYLTTQETRTITYWE